MPRRFLAIRRWWCVRVDNSTRAIGTFLSETLGDDIDGDTSVHELAACIEDNKDYVAEYVAHTPHPHLYHIIVQAS